MSGAGLTDEDRGDIRLAAAVLVCLSDAQESHKLAARLRKIAMPPKVTMCEVCLTHSDSMHRGHQCELARRAGFGCPEDGHCSIKRRPV